MQFFPDAYFEGNEDISVFIAEQLAVVKSGQRKVGTFKVGILT
jgi:hypothetical protein